MADTTLAAGQKQTFDVARRHAGTDIPLGDRIILSGFDSSVVTFTNEGGQTMLVGLAEGTTDVTAQWSDGPVSGSFSVEVTPDEGEPVEPDSLVFTFGTPVPA